MCTAAVQVEGRVSPGREYAMLIECTSASPPATTPAEGPGRRVAVLVVRAGGYLLVMVDNGWLRWCLWRRRYFLLSACEDGCHIMAFGL